MGFNSGFKGLMWNGKKNVLAVRRELATKYNILGKKIRS